MDSEQDSDALEILHQILKIILGFNSVQKHFMSKLRLTLLQVDDEFFFSSRKNLIEQLESNNPYIYLGDLFTLLTISTSRSTKVCHITFYRCHK